LTERDGGRLDDAAAGAANGQRAACEKDLADGLEFVAGAALEAGGIGGVSVQFDHLLGGDARFLVQPVDVLGNDGAGRAAPYQFRNRFVTPVGLGRGNGLVAVELSRPVLAPGVGRFHELAEVDGTVTLPDSAGASEIGDSGFGADAGAREDDWLAPFEWSSVNVSA
jgi:hypothetical protein